MSGDRQSPRSFPSVDLSAQDKAVVWQAARTFLDEEVAEYLQFTERHTDRRPLSHDWKMLVETDEMRVFTPQKSRQAIVAPTADGMSVLLGTGIVQGALTDCAYGASARTWEEKLVNMAYNDEYSQKCGEVCMLEEPTPDDPFRSMKIFWFVKEMKGPLRLLVKDHDSVFIQATGVLLLPNDERLAYDLVHSIDLPDLPELKKYTRVNMSTCILWRERSVIRSEFYMRAFVDLRDANPVGAKLALRDIARAYTSFANYGHVGKMKKLAWLLRRKARQGQPDFERKVQSKTCISCGAGSTSFLRRRKTICALCGFPVCPNCRVTKQMVAVAPNERVQTFDMTLCVGCWRETELASAEEIALDEVMHDAASRSERGRFLAFATMLQEMRSSSDELELEGPHDACD